ncbi:hypothetical protein GVAV_000597 [Gurleya vavrai]
MSQNLSLTKTFQENIHVYEPNCNNVPFHWFSTYYQNSKSFICKIQNSWYILISIKSLDNLTRVLVRSVFGFKEFKMASHLITNEFLFIKKSIDCYLFDTLGIKVQKKETMANKFFSIFGSLSENKNSKGIKHLKDNQLYSKKDCFTFKEKIFKLKNSILENTESVSFENLRESFYAIDDEEAICMLDNNMKDIHISIEGDLLIQENIFGKKLDFDYIENTQDMNLPKNENKNHKQAVFSILEFYETEINYLNLLLVCENEILISLKNDKSSERLNFISNSFGHVEEILKFQKQFISHLFYFLDENDDLQKQVFELMRNTNKFYATDFISKIKKNCFLYDNKNQLEFLKRSIQGEENNQVNFILKNIFNLFLKTNFNCYENYILNEDHYRQNIDKQKDSNALKILKHSELKNILIAPVQRYTRYILLLKQLVSCCKCDEIYDIGKEAYIKIQKHAVITNIKKEKQEKMKICFVLQRNIKKCPPDLVNPSRFYIDFLDIENFTLFLFNDLLLITQRNCLKTNLDLIDKNSHKFIESADICDVFISYSSKNYQLTFSKEINYFKNIFHENNEYFNFAVNETSKIFIEKVQYYKCIYKPCLNAKVMVKKASINYFFTFSKNIDCDFKIFIGKEKTNTKNFLLEIIVNENIHVINNNTIIKVTHDEFYNNFYFFLKNAIDLEQILSNTPEKELLLFNSHLSKLYKQKTSRISPPKQTKISLIKKECEYLENIVFANRKQLNINLKNYKHIEHAKNSCSKNPYLLYKKGFINHGDLLIAKSSLVLEYWRETIMLNFAHEKIKELNLNIDHIKSIKDLKKYGIADDHIIVTFLKHFIEIYKIIDLPRFDEIFKMLFFEIEMNRVESFYRHFLSNVN